MENSKKGYTPMMEKPDYRKSQGAKTPTEVQRMQRVPYASVVGSIIRFQQNPGEIHWTAVKTILKYLRNTKDMVLVYGAKPEDELKVSCYADASFQTEKDDTKFQTGYVFVLNGGAVDWKSAKQSTNAKSSTKAEYIAATEASMEAVWMRKFIDGLGDAMPSNKRHMEMLCDNEPALAIASDLGILKGARHFQRKYHYIREVIQESEIVLKQVHIDDNVADPFTKPMPFNKRFEHAMAIGIVPANEEMHDAETIKTGKDKDEMTVAVEADVEETAEEEVDDELSPLVLNVPVSVIPEPLVLSPIPEITTETPVTTALSSPLIITIISLVQQQQTAPIPTTPIPTPPITIEAPIAKLEKEVFKLKQVDHSSKILASIQSQVPSVVNAYLGTSLGDSLQKVATSLAEYELKNILYDKMHESQSHLTHDTNQELYDALAWSIKLNENNSTRGRNPDTVLKKIDRESVKETITKVVIDDAVNTAVADVVHDVDQPQDASKQKTDKTPKYNWFTQPPRPPTLDPEWNTVQVVDDAPEEHLFNDLLSAENDPLTFDAFMAIPIDFSKFSMNRIKIEKLTKAHFEGPIYQLLKGTCESSIELEYNMEECYKALTDKLDWNNL
ncbi:hypothetical protein Tco_1179087 [Tanacetum coccineum]